MNQEALYVRVGKDGQVILLGGKCKNAQRMQFHEPDVQAVFQ